MTEGMPFDDPGPIAHVREGMKVVDVEGHEVGKVGFVRMGDPDAVTARGQEAGGGGGIIGAVAAALTDEERLPRQARDELARVGYVRIDRHGWAAGICSRRRHRWPGWRAASSIWASGRRASCVDLRPYTRPALPLARKYRVK